MWYHIKVIYMKGGLSGLENIYEKCIVKPKDAKDNLITLATVVGSIAIIAASIIIEFTRSYSAAVIVVVVIAAHRIITDRNIEYEYTLAGNSIAMDKILNRKRRKRILNCDLTDFDIVAPVKSRHYEEYRNNAAKTISAVSGGNAGDEYFGLLEYKGRRTILLFEADERSLGLMKKHLEYKLKD
ncbi:MAG: hypothetical protein JXB33_06735 [Clostridia bacterium]|nr:hypothetical protein [Clostridia bacterium]